MANIQHMSRHSIHLNIVLDTTRETLPFCQRDVHRFLVGFTHTLLPTRKSQSPTLLGQQVKYGQESVITSIVPKSHFKARFTPLTTAFSSAIFMCHDRPFSSATQHPRQKQDCLHHTKFNLFHSYQHGTIPSQDHQPSPSPQCHSSNDMLFHQRHHPNGHLYSGNSHSCKQVAINCIQDSAHATGHTTRITASLSTLSGSAKLGILFPQRKCNAPPLFLESNNPRTRPPSNSSGGLVSKPNLDK
ncbi:hypothetical protein SK128_025857 [Halocaridina rubra]|uniref:Uncharacterized protein n=1 Tax=Halocaridina rubra TaxID=373956 RepID=A0AAN8ZQ03_HALRR